MLLCQNVTIRGGRGKDHCAMQIGELSNCQQGQDPIFVTSGPVSEVGCAMFIKNVQAR